MRTKVVHTKSKVRRTKKMSLSKWGKSPATRKGGKGDVKLSTIDPHLKKIGTVRKSQGEKHSQKRHVDLLRKGGVAKKKKERDSTEA